MSKRYSISFVIVKFLIELCLNRSNEWLIIKTQYSNVFSGIMRGQYYLKFIYIGQMVASHRLSLHNKYL